MHDGSTSWWWAGTRGAGACRLMHARGVALALALAFALALVSLLAARVAGAQSLLERPPTMPSGWVGVPGTLQFNFVHRFTHSDAPARKVSSSPTLTVAAGLPWHALLGVGYASNSDVAPAYPNEWEAFGRWAPFGQDRNGPVDASVQLGYNVAARSADGEFALGRRVGPLQLRAAARYLSDAYALGDAKSVLAGGGVLRLGRFVALAGDYATMLDRPAGYDAVWSAGVQLAIPYSPHTLSIHATNANTGTLQGVSAARDAAPRRWGFEFTVPLTLRRFVPRRATPPVVSTAPDTTSAAIQATSTTSAASAMSSPPVPADTTSHADSSRAAPSRADTSGTVRDTTSRRDTSGAAPAVRPAPAPAKPAVPTRAAPRLVRTDIRQNAYGNARIVVPVGSTVTWTNRDPMIHSVTSDDKAFDSGLIEPGKTFTRRFDRTGTYTFHCTPHPFMKGVVVVR